MDSLQNILAVSKVEAARMLSVSPRTIQNYLSAQILIGRKIGRRTVIPVLALKAFLATDQASPERRFTQELKDAKALSGNSEGLGKNHPQALDGGGQLETNECEYTRKKKNGKQPLR